jgi:hypothetical protein
MQRINVFDEGVNKYGTKRAHTFFLSQTLTNILRAVFLLNPVVSSNMWTIETLLNDLSILLLWKLKDGLSVHRFVMTISLFEHVMSFKYTCSR